MEQVTMMTTLAQDVHRETLAKGGKAWILSPAELDELLGEIVRRYCKGTGAIARPLWHSFGPAPSKHDPDAWRTLSALLGDQEIVVIIEDFSELSAVRISTGLLLTDVLSETVGFVFYVTNAAADYVLCFNDHDVLIGLGLAADWISGDPARE